MLETRPTPLATLGKLVGTAGFSVALLCGAGALTASLTTSATAAEEGGHHVEKQDWSFAGVFGQFDQAQLQRGLKVYREACAGCHSMHLVPFRTLADPHGPNLSEGAAEQIASEYTVEDISNEDGQPFERPATLTDHFPSPFPNAAAAAAANGGAAPPDFSLIAKARAVHRGFPGFITDAFAGYSESGPDYIFALLQGYTDPPEGVEEVPGKYYNPIFVNGQWIAMPPPLEDGRVEYTDGSPETVEQYSADIAAFLMWAAEPHLEERKQIGFRVMVFLLVFAVLLYATKKKLWRNVEH
ncbi:cytochrome c1 [Acuticoccus sediminis]|uniref:Cytochrome c1 n=1 Tax=Acuticoccus sediminis TaxID=2184697 RepID=A0A8B2NV94_9HYPH|nr:cytochrome c1 [Acuticoccus sediminis]RAI04087.1 cytochrome c1 [Acuticoccus sediminis]